MEVADDGLEQRLRRLFPGGRPAGTYLMAARIEISGAVIGKVGDSEPVFWALSNLL
jgi:hypothetical protein